MGLKVDIQKKVGEFELDINFEVKGKPLALLGSSGSGKSMTLRCIAGLEEPDKGEILLGDKTLFHSGKKINLQSGRRKVGFIFQNYALFPHMTVYENIAFGLERMSKDKRDEIIDRELKKVHLTNFGDRYPSQLSGGQQQRVAIARAMSLEPEILLFDEPFSALDNHTRGLVVREMGETLADFDGTAIVVTHNMDEAYSLCEDIVVINNGNKERSGTKDCVFNNPMTIQTARLTGCKNIVQAQKVDKDSIYIEDWNCFLKVKLPEDKEISYIGYRAHYIELGETHEKENCVLCTLEYISEGPFQITSYMRPVNSLREDSVIQCEFTKEYWKRFENPEGLYNIRFSNKKILFF